MFVRDLSFRSLLARPLFVKYDASRLFDHDRLERLCWPEGADSVLCYVYYDRQAGLNLDVLAPTRFEDGAIFHEAAPMRVAEVRMMLRPDVYGDREAKFLSKHDEDRVLERYAEQCDISDGYWKSDPNLVALGLAEAGQLPGAPSTLCRRPHRPPMCNNIHRPSSAKGSSCLSEAPARSSDRLCVERCGDFGTSRAHSR